MKFPKQKEQDKYMGRLCSFNAELYKDYGKEKSKENEDFGVTRTVPVKWIKCKPQKSSGWIVGFGFCFNGTLCTETNLGPGYKYFRASKRVNYVRVRTTPMGKELKVPTSSIKLL